jgi:hypothetical protein
MPDRLYLTIAEVTAIHKQQIEQYGGIDGIRDRSLLESAVFRPQTGYYASVAEEAAALMESLANTHFSMATSAPPLQQPTRFFSSMVWTLKSVLILLSIS